MFTDYWSPVCVTIVLTIRKESGLRSETTIFLKDVVTLLSSSSEIETKDNLVLRVHSFYLSSADASFRQYPHAAAAETHARAFSASVHRYLRIFRAPPVLDEVAQPVVQQSFHGLVSAGQRVGDDDL